MKTKELFAAIDKQDIAGFLSFLHDDVHFVFGNMPAMQGVGQVELGVTQFFSAIISLKHKLEREYVDGDSVIVRGTVTYTKLDEHKLTVPFCNVLEYEGEKIKKYFIYVDISELF